MSNKWYYTKDGKNQFGPFDDNKFLSLAIQGAISPKDYVRTDEMKKWVLAENIKGIKFSSIPEISIPISDLSVKSEKVNNNTIGITSGPPMVSSETNAPSQHFQNKEPLDKKNQASSEVKSSGSGIGSTILAAGAGAAIGMGVGALLGNTISSGSRQAINPSDFFGLSQRLKTLNMQGLLSDLDYQSILQLINDQAIGSDGQLLPNRMKKRSPLNLKSKGRRSSGKNIVDADEADDGDSFMGEESDSDLGVVNENSKSDIQQEEEIFDAEDVPSDFDDEEILEAETFGDEDADDEVESELSDVESEVDDIEEEDFQDEDFQDEDMDDMEDADLGDEDFGGDDYSTYDSGGDD